MSYFFGHTQQGLLWQIVTLINNLGLYFHPDQANMEAIPDKLRYITGERASQAILYGRSEYPV